MKLLKKNPKLSISVIITIILEIYSMISQSSEILGISSKTMALISLIVSVISLVWNQLKPDESVFKMAYRHVGSRPSTPPQDPNPDDD